MDSPNSSWCTLEPKSTAALSTCQQITQKKQPETSHSSVAAEDCSAAGFRVVGRSMGRRRRAHEKNISEDGGEESTDEKAEVERKIVTLQKIVPGGERLPVDELFEETAEYILALECQVKALRFLADLVQSSDKRERMLGG